MQYGDQGGVFTQYTRLSAFVQQQEVFSRMFDASLRVTQSGIDTSLEDFGPVMDSRFETCRSIRHGDIQSAVSNASVLVSCDELVAFPGHGSQSYHR